MSNAKVSHQIGTDIDQIKAMDVELIVFAHVLSSLLSSLLTRQEKEKLILDLYNQGNTYKQIAETVRVSPRDIKPVLEKSRKREGKRIRDKYLRRR